MRYKYQAIDAQGQEVSGIVNTEGMREAARQLQHQDLTLVQLDAVDVKTPIRGAAGKPKKRDTFIVLHELTTLLESGVSLIEAVESLAESSHHPFLTQTFAEIAAKLRQGASFSATLAGSGLELPWYIPQLAEAGELTGKVGQALHNGVEQMEYDARISGEMRNAMIYPSVLIFSGTAAVLLIFTLVVPRFAGILKNKGEDIPFLAQAVLNSGMFLNEHFQWIAAGAALFAVIAVYLAAQPRMRARLQDYSTRLPVLGVWILEAETGRWASMMGTLLENRVPLLRALELALQGMKLPGLRARLAQTGKAVRAGTSLSQALQDNDAVTPTGHNLIRAGERAGELPRMLKSLAKLFEESGRMRMKRFLLLIEPAAILIIGSVIGLIITGVILAITSVNQIAF
ncbi:MAG: type II secretion system F family protein [Gammaproteobacteria bacterium]|nr:type II secretion system F family protein [Gammaproteobacteria bacterium]